jgi:hypothetical protein
MSFDPFASGDQPPSEYVTNAPPPGNSTFARQRAQAPGIGLIVIGVLNLLLALVPSFYGLSASKMPLAQLEQDLRNQNPKGLDDLKAAGWTVADIRNLIVNVSYSLAGADFLACFLVILGGVRMLSLKNYGLSVLAAIVAALPGLSCSGCCGVGAIVGIWALVVLLNPDVRAAFH